MFDDLTMLEDKMGSKKQQMPEEFGYDEQTDTHFMKERRRRPTRYFVSEDGHSEKFT